MPTGRKPPFMPRNTLAEGRIAGRKPPLPFRVAMHKHLERQRLVRGMKAIAAIGGAPAPPRRIEMMAARNAVHPGRDQALERAGRIIRAAHDRATRDAAADLGDGTEANEGASDTRRSVRPPRPAPGRYAGLKDGQPG